MPVDYTSIHPGRQLVAILNSTTDRFLLLCLCLEKGPGRFLSRVGITGQRLPARCSASGYQLLVHLFQSLPASLCPLTGCPCAVALLAA
jgi:hypothetical protein